MPNYLYANSVYVPLSKVYLHLSLSLTLFLPSPSPSLPLLFPQSFPVESNKITSLCCVINYMWLGTEEGKLFIYDAINKNTLINRQLTSTPGQGIVAIYHQLTLR